MQDAKRTSQSVRAREENFVITGDLKAVLKKDGWRKPSNALFQLNIDVVFDCDALHEAMGAIIKEDRVHFIVFINKLILLL